LIDAIIYSPSTIITKVEVSGKHLKENDQQIWSEMRIVNAWKWTKKDSVSLLIYIAELYIENFKKIGPKIDKPTPDIKKSIKTINSAKKWLKNPTKENELNAGLMANKSIIMVHWTIPDWIKNWDKELNKEVLLLKLECSLAHKAELSHTFLTEVSTT